MMNEQREFWSRVAQAYDRVVDLQIGGATRLMIRERLSKEESLGHVIELGSGTGFYTQLLADRATSLIASDLSPRMLDLAKQRINATNVTFQTEDCQDISLPNGVFDTAFISLVLHFTNHQKTLKEMDRILKPGGTLIIANLDPKALRGLDRVRCLVRVLYRGLIGYRTKPPKGFSNVVAGESLCNLLHASGFEKITSETIRDTSSSSNIPIEYIRAAKRQ
jgi:ubiquinone/menaquinone biosynthesis C-methylase UbiE